MSINKLSNQAEQVLIGSMLGDGSMQKRGNSINYIEKHGINQKEYLIWKKKYFDRFFKTKLSYTKDNKAIYFITNSSLLLKQYHQLFYPNGKGHKIVTEEILNKLKPLGIAIWFMDDGGRNRKTSFIATNKNFVDLISKWFKKKYKIVGWIQKDKKQNGASFSLNAKSNTIFIKIIKPYIQKSMSYKIELSEKEEKELLNYYKEQSKKYRNKDINKYRILQRIRSKRFYKKHKEDIKKQQKLYRSKPEVKEKERQYRKEYYQRPEVILHRKEYFSRPEWKAHKKEYDKKRRENAKKS